MSETIGTAIIDIKGDTSKLIKGMDNAEKGVNKAIGNMKKTIIGLGAAFVSVQTAVKAFETGINFTKTAMQFEKFSTVLKTIEGSAKKADSSMAWITDFTKRTPYELSKVTDSFVKLKAYGIDPTGGTLRVLGDTASAMGKDLGQAVEAMADAVTGENERLKEFGIKASKTGDLITYKWTSASGEAKEAIVENNSQIIQSTLEAIFNSKYAGAMDAQSRTLEGMLSNINDSYTIFQKNVMDAGLFDYIKALTQVFGVELNEAFGVTARNSEVFSNSMIESINGAIRGVGVLANALQGIGVFMEVSWLTVSASFDALVVTIIGGAASMIDALNKIPGVDIDNSWSTDISKNAVKSFYDNIKQINGSLDGLVDYEKKAVGFVQKSAVAFEKFKTNAAGASTYVNNLEFSEKNNASEESKKIAKANKKAYDSYIAITGTDYEQWLNKTNNTMMELASSGSLTSEELQKAYDVMNQEYNSSVFDKMAKDAKDSSKEIQYVFTNAFKGMEDSLVNFAKTGKMNFGDLADSILTDMLRVAIQSSITQPLMGAMSGAMGSLFAFENGGIMTNQGAIPLKAYADGGVASSPQLALYGEGSMPEAYVPLPDGRTIPVTMKGQGGSGNVVINVQNNTSEDISAEQISEMTRTNERGEQEKVITFVLDGVNRNLMGSRDMFKALK